MSAVSASAGKSSRARLDVRLPAIARVYARLALGSAFLSAVAARLGLWDGRHEPFRAFVASTAETLSFLPPVTAPFFAVAATVCELGLGLLLVAGVRPRETAIASAVLLATFGIAMAISFGPKSPLDSSVFSASACALLLAGGGSRQ
jgi:uncharacterized membrane protein YphA (DoxX/SURF4 family)